MLHEFGHYITARMFKVRVLKFYLFFDFLFPFPNIWNKSLVKKKVGHTEYGIGWFPLGGYVQMAGIMDESMDKDALKEPVKPYEFRAKPAWQRLIILLGGIAVNVILAIFIYAFILFTWGEQKLPVQNMTYGLYADSLAQSIGLQSGDYIVSVDGEEVEFAGRETALMLLNKGKSIKVLRGDETIDLPVEGSFYKTLVENRGLGFVSIARLSVIGGYSEDSPMKAAGGEVGDRIISLNNTEVAYFQDVSKFLTCRNNQDIMVGVERNGDTIPPFIVTTTETGMLGIGARSADEIFEYTTKEYGFFESFPAGVRRSKAVLENYIQQFGLIFDKEIQGYKQIGGFGAIGSLFPSTVNWREFWEITAFLSIMLAFLNLLPIPALDGGHALFTVYEMIFRRPPHERFMEMAQLVGMILLFALVIYANGNDVLRLFNGPTNPCG
ncbi:MAG: RIP metalloprotease RseP [Bacteroidetes bacterium]|nr:RIP metalloprotease RseP [Bacteroidota bacterium]